MRVTIQWILTKDVFFQHSINEETSPIGCWNISKWIRIMIFEEKLSLLTRHNFTLKDSWINKIIKFETVITQRVTHTYSMHSQKVTLWCGISSFGVIGSSSFFKNGTGITLRWGLFLSCYIREIFCQNLKM